MTLIDTTTPFGRRVERHLADDVVAWLVTVRRDGLPQPSPIWFLRDRDDSLLLYSQPRTPKLRNIARSPLVAVHFDGDGRGGDIVVLSGEARVAEDEPGAHEVPAYVEKYAELIAGNGWTPESFAADYSVPVRIHIASVRGH